MRLGFIFALAVPVLLHGPLLAQAADWPLPGGARQTALVDDVPGRYTIAMGPADLDSPPATIEVEGTRRRTSYLLETADLSAFGVAQQIQAAIEANDWTIDFHCSQPDCGGYDFRKSRDVIPLPDMFVDLGQFQYISARPADGTSEAMEILVSRFNGDIFIQVNRISDPSPSPNTIGRFSDNHLSEPDAEQEAPDDFDEALRQNGRIVIEGLQFAEGSTQVDASGSPTIGILAEWLNADQSRRIAVVGHSDWNGSFEANRSVSRARAESVATLLRTKYGVASGQMEIHGAAYLAPLSANTTATKRNRNRRVEAILLPHRK